MKQLLFSVSVLAAVSLVAACTPDNTTSARSPASAPAAAIPYGANEAAGATFVHDGVTLYYEVYGEGEPLLLVHGNGASIGTLAKQIEFFKATHKVIAMDSRDHGRSSDSSGPLTYEKMADDLAALLDHVHSGPADIVGWSDGGIEALLMGVRHPDKVRKLVAMAAGLNPDAVYPETDKLLKDMLAAVPADAKTTPEGKRNLKVTTIMLTEPHIEPALLGRIEAPTLVLSGDHDLIRLEHTIQIFNSLPNANLAVFSNSTHMVPYDDPQLFNTTVQRFPDTPFKKKDRIPDTMASFEKVMAGLAR